MKKILLSTSVIGLFFVYSVYLHLPSDQANVVAPVVVTTPTAETAIPTSTPVGKYRDGEYTGNVADAYYGNIQVKTVIQSGKITAVQFLQYPSDRQTSIEINTQAMPYLQ